MQHKSKWVTPLSKSTFPAMRLFCFPYSGGSAQIYKPWADRLPASLQVCGIQYPGRGSRFAEPPLTSIDTLLRELLPELKPFLDIPFAIFGHSLGAAIGFEVTRVLQREGRLPRALFVSGRNAPHLPRNTELLHNLPEPEFRKKLHELGGTSPEVLEHPELMDLVAPLVRADFTMSETYRFAEGPLLGCPLLAFGGERDPLVPVTGIQEWERHAGAGFSHTILPGAHFFLDDSRDALLSQISATLAL